MIEIETWKLVLLVPAGLFVGGVLAWTVLTPLRRRLAGEETRWQDKVALVFAVAGALIYVSAFIVGPLLSV